MNRMVTKRSLKLFAILAAGVSSLIYAIATFIPTTQPPVLLGQYAVKDRDLYNSAGTKAYRPWFENGAWQGDLIEYTISAAGVRSTDVVVGNNPATAGINGDCGRTAPSGCWSARATFIANGADNPTGTYWQSRNIFTNNNGQKSFGWDQLSATQRAGLDPDTVAAALAAPTLNGNAYASPILNYIRGERLHERANDTEAGSSGDLRTRYSVLGDITSTPVYIGPPEELLGRVTGYNTFARDNASRAGRIAVGANDGMLHVFDEADGSEVFAYIPSKVIDRLYRLAGRDEAYTHTYYVDGELTTGSAQIQGNWHTLLGGSGGAGFAGLYALDMTNPAYTSSKLLFEKSGGNWGHIYGRPRIAPVGGTNAAPNWYLFAGNGYSTSPSHPTSLMMVDLNDYGVDLQDFSVTEIPITTPAFSGSVPVTGGLSAPVLQSTDHDDMVELAFAGDFNGDLWMFILDESDLANSEVIKVYDGDPDQPISNAPAITEHPTENGYMVYFGTGSIFSLEDALNDGESSQGSDTFGKTQAIHGIWVDTSDITKLKTRLPYSRSDLQSQSILTLPGYTFGTTTESVRIVPSENAVLYSCPLSTPSCMTRKGWKVSLPNCGERLVGTPFVRAGRVQFVTHNPTGAINCGADRFPGDNWVMSLDFLTGGDDSTVVYNLNGDTALNNSDAVLHSGNFKPPVGLSLGSGNISQPTFTRLKPGVDKMFINGMLLAFPTAPAPGPLYGGHIDVTIDSPYGGEIATNNVSKHSEGYNVQTPDGLGRAVDGHIHDYDTMHDVDYVDLLELEPRRGKANLVTTLAPVAPVSEVCSTTINSKAVLVPDPGDPSGNSDRCIEAIEGEFNRAYDILHTDGDGSIDPLNGTDASGSPAPIYQSELSSGGTGFNATTPADFTKPVTGKQFIVTLANADRSIGGTLQIGCRTWPVVEYQDMITQQLQDGRSSTGTLADQNGVSLVLTLAGIMAENPANCPGGANSSISPTDAALKGLSNHPTLRVGFGRRSILDEGLHATRSQCVLGLHDYRDAVCYSDAQVLTAAEAALNHAPPPDPAFSYSSCNSFGSTVPVNYIRDPARQLHITEVPSSEGKGYRWRNGALTVQLLDAAINPATNLQDPATMPGDAGTHARAYTVSKLKGNTIISATSADESNPPDESGLFYEASMFWHYSTLVDEIRNADPAHNATPTDAGCYGGAAYGGKSNSDAGGLNPSDYLKLTNPLIADCAAVAMANAAKGTIIPCDLDRFGNLLEIIDNAQTDAELNQALLNLAALLAGNPDLAAYASLRDYVGRKVKESDRLDIDKSEDGGGGGNETGTADATPASVTTIETIDLEARGPNYILGRRNWVDIRQ